MQLQEIRVDVDKVKKEDLSARRKFKEVLVFIIRPLTR